MSEDRRSRRLLRCAWRSHSEARRQHAFPKEPGSFRRTRPGLLLAQVQAQLPAVHRTAARWAAEPRRMRPVPAFRRSSPGFGTTFYETLAVVSLSWQPSAILDAMR